MGDDCDDCDDGWFFYGGVDMVNDGVIDVKIVWVISISMVEVSVLCLEVSNSHYGFRFA